MPFFDAKDKSRYATFSRRTLVLSGGMASVFALLVGRLYQLQIVDGSLYLTQAEDNRISDRLLAPPRGRIMDRFGVVLAGNRRNYRTLIVPEQTDGLETALGMLARVIPLPEHQRERVLREARTNARFVPIMVAENLAWDDFARLNLDLPYLKGVQTNVGETRDYPFGAELSHVLGYVGSVSPEDKIDAPRPDDPLLSLPGFRIGKRGVERAFEGDIRGAGGVSRVEVNAHGRVIRELQRNEGLPGNDLYLTIDRELQSFTHERLREESAACTVMDVETGDVLALVSTPGYDPNGFNVGLSNNEWNSLTQDPYKPLLNKVLSGTYPPGSTFKIAVALSALENGTITPDTAFSCGGYITVGGRRFHCWRRGGHGRVNLHLGLKYSCDCYFYEVARRLGIDALSVGANKLGLGEATGIEIPGERSGLIPTREWKRANFNEGWQQGDTVNAGIGQGFITATPMQLCTMAARLAGGKMVSPRLVHRLGEPRALAKSLGIADEHLAAVQAGLNGVMNEPGGTAYRSRIAEPEFAFAGKTGTAQVRRITAAERATGVVRNDQLPWELRDHALFVAFAPVVNPRYALSVVIEHGSSGSGAAAPVARDVLRFAQERHLLNMPTAYPIASLSPTVNET
jgi:penicillin-binding protein 2